MDWLEEPLSPTEAAEESAWEGGTVAKKIRSGDLPQAGVEGKPRVRRADLYGITVRESRPKHAEWARAMVNDNV